MNFPVTRYLGFVTGYHDPRMTKRYCPCCHSSPSLDPSEDGLEQVKIEEISLERDHEAKSTRISEWLGTISRWFGTDVKRPAAARRNVAGFMDLPGEIRNMIYRLIWNQIDPLARLRWPTGKTMVFTNAYLDTQTLAIVDVSPQVRQEFLTLLIFGDTEVTAKDLAIYGPRSLSSPAYVNGGTICIAGKKLDVTHSCVSEDPPTSYASLYTRAERHSQTDLAEMEIAVVKAEYNGDGRRTASFCFDLDARVELTLSTRRLITRILAKIFRSNEDIGIERLFLATHCLLIAKLEAICNNSDNDLENSHEVQFEVSVATEGPRPEIWVTPHREVPRSS